MQVLLVTVMVLAIRQWTEIKEFSLQVDDGEDDDDDDYNDDGDGARQLPVDRDQRVLLAGPFKCDMLLFHFISSSFRVDSL